MAAMVDWRKAGRWTCRKSCCEVNMEGDSSSVERGFANTQGAMKKCGNSLRMPLCKIIKGGRTASIFCMADLDVNDQQLLVRPHYIAGGSGWWWMILVVTMLVVIVILALMYAYDDIAWCSCQTCIETRRWQDFDKFCFAVLFCLALSLRLQRSPRKKKHRSRLRTEPMLHEKSYRRIGKFSKHMRNTY